MDISTYVNNLTKNGGDLTEFARQAGMSRVYLGHILNGHKRNPSIKTVVGLVVASNGEISIRSLRPDLFPSSRKGAKALELIRKAAA